LRQIKKIENEKVVKLKNIQIMKKLFIVFLSMFVMSITIAQAQSNQPDPKLIEGFGQETVDFYIQNAPELIAYYNFFVNYSYKIVDLPQEKMSELDNIPSFQIKEKFISEPVDYSEQGLQNLNILKYDFKLDQIGSMIYKIGNTNKLIVFYSGKEIQTMFNETQKTK
jgi:hypothetical protein